MWEGENKVWKQHGRGERHLTGQQLVASLQGQLDCYYRLSNGKSSWPIAFRILATDCRLV